MPYVQLNTNVKLSSEQLTALKVKSADLITVIPGKTPEVTMIEVNDGLNMYFRGSEEPCARVRVDVSGFASVDAKKAYTEVLGRLIQETAGVEPSRQYVTFSEYNGWGVNGTFRG